MTPLWIILATLAGGIVSVFLAATLALTALAKFANRMVAFAVGVLLGFAFTDLLPEAVHLGLDITTVGWMLLIGIMGFFLLEKLALWRHDHSTLHGHSLHKSATLKPQVTTIIIGDGMHNFVDGVLIAAAFLTNWNLGWATAIAVTAHEIPQEISDFMVLLDGGLSKSHALLLNTLSGAAMTLGGVLGWLMLDHAKDVIPYALSLAAASFIYIAVADLVPELQQRRQPRDTVLQFSLMILGIGMAVVAKRIQ